MQEGAEDIQIGFGIGQTQVEEAMKHKQLSKNQMAKAMHTSLSQLDRILDPGNKRIQLDTMIKAAHVLGRELRIELV